MKKQISEKLKTWLLVILFFTGVIQVGIHMSLQAQGFPFRFVDAIFSFGSNTTSELKDLSEAELKTAKDAYFKPDNIIVSISLDSNQWILPENQAHYQSIWNDAKQYYIPVIYSKKPDKILTKDDWVLNTNKTCTIIDFPVLLPNELISWFGDISISGNYSFKGIKSIAILPLENVNETVNTVYVYDEETVHVYNVQIDPNALPKNFYRNLPEALKNQDEIISASTLGDTFPKLAQNPAIPIYLDLYSSTRMQSVQISIPDALVLTQEEDTESGAEGQRVEGIRESILLNQRDSLMASLSANTATFSDTENVYKLDASGTLNYKYLPASEVNEIDISAAFIHALSFIELRRDLLNKVDITLSSIKEEKGVFTFTFDYTLNGFRVLVYDNRANSTGSVSSAITIKASADRVLECRWVMRRFNPLGNYHQYSNSFIDLVENKIMSESPDILRNRLFAGIEEGYIFDASKRESLILYPSWIIATSPDKEGTQIIWNFIPMSEED